MRKAFTLIELMIVVAIIAFLASIAIPRYSQYFSKAKQAEVAIFLSALHTAEQTYWYEHGTYSTNLNEIGFELDNHHYSYGFFFPSAKEGVNFFTGKLGGTKTVNGTHCFAEQNKFVAAAIGNSEDLWTINEKREIQTLRE